jgi:hypothetical protein
MLLKIQVVSVLAVGRKLWVSVVTAVETSYLFSM